VRKDGGPDGRGVGFYFRNVTELLLFGVKESMRTLQPGRSQVNIVVTRKEEHSRTPDSVYDLIRGCSPGPYIELFARQRIDGWEQWGNEVDAYEGKRAVVKGYNGWSVPREETPALPLGTRHPPRASHGERTTPRLTPAHVRPGPPDPPEPE
jgi:hypothetical protein